MTNPLIILFLGLCLLVDYRLAGAFIVIVGVFTMLTLRG
jgi:hypothetical protein